MGLDFNFKVQLREREDFKDVPIIINSFNRLEFLKQLVDCMQSRGYNNLYIIDNKSTYKPLLEYYRQKQLRVFYLDKNIGCLSIWETPIFQQFKTDYYVYTDPDIVPEESCPNDFMIKFKEGLDRYPDLQKVGFSLKIDDLPDNYVLKNEVISHEEKFWEKKLDDSLYDSPVDTTFALYRPFAEGGWQVAGARTAPPYVAKHLPWYNDSSKFSEEEKFYRKSLLKIKDATHWSSHPKEFQGLDKWIHKTKTFLLDIYNSLKKIIKKIIRR